MHYESGQYDFQIVQCIHNSVSFQVKTKRSVLVWYFLHQSPGNSRLQGHPTQPLLCFLCCCGDKVVPFVLCVQVHLLRLSYYHGSFVTLEKYPAWIFSKMFPKGWASCEHQGPKREEPQSEIQTGWENICCLLQLCCVRDYAFRTGFCHCTFC